MAIDFREIGGSEAAPVPEVFNGATFASDPTVPSSVVAGQTIRITGVAGFDCTTCVVDREIRIVADFSHLSEPVIDNVGKLSGRGQTAQFVIEAPAPAQVGQTISVRLKAQRKPPLSGWKTDNTRGPFDINTVTQGQKTTRSALAAAPWAVAGGAVGAGAASLGGQPLSTGGAIGTGVGLGAYALTDGQGIGNLVPEFPTTAVALTGGTLLAGALFLGALPDAPSLPRPG